MPRGGGREISLKCVVSTRTGDRVDQSQSVTPLGIGKHSRDMDAALPGKHMKGIFYTLSKKEAGILAQLRTGMARVNGYLYRIAVSRQRSMQLQGRE